MGLIKLTHVALEIVKTDLIETWSKINISIQYIYTVPDER